MAFLLIIIICYIIVAIIRKTKIPNEWLPLISGTVGLSFSAIAVFAFPTMIPEQSIIATLIYGFFCGLAATGSNQILKQTLKYIKKAYGIDIELLVSKLEDPDDTHKGE